MRRRGRHSCTSPLDLSELVSYRAGELDATREAEVEERYFECQGCSERLRWVEQLASAVTGIVHRGGVRVAITEAFLADARAAGIAIREYQIAPGGSVQCTVAPDDDFVVVRLLVRPLSVSTVRVRTNMTDLERGMDGRAVTEDAVVDQSSHAVLYAFPGDIVRGFPKSRWVMSVSADVEGIEQSVGPFTMEHTPTGG